MGFERELADRRQAFDRRFNFWRKAMIVYTGVLFVAAIALGIATIHVISNPEMIGQYIGQIVTGMESAR